MLCDFVEKIHPSSVLVGATHAGRSLAPRAAARLGTGLTADCTALEMRENTDLVQIRPAFGGNIMAQIVTPNHRPQMATVRYKVMDAPARSGTPSGEIAVRAVTPAILLSSVEWTLTQDYSSDRGATIVTAAPLRPARPVRPIRWV